MQVWSLVLTSYGLDRKYVLWWKPRAGGRRSPGPGAGGLASGVGCRAALGRPWPLLQPRPLFSAGK